MARIKTTFQEITPDLALADFKAQVVLMLACFPYTLAWFLAAVAGSYQQVYLLYLSR